jgi:outer membrane biosynthesis protein TonB
MAVTYTHQEFERQKNLKALGLTIAVCAIIFLLMFLVSWTLPQPEQPIADEGIEVNLGNSDQGMGNIAPEVPGEMSNSDETNIQSPKTAAAQSEPEEEKEVAENNDNDVPVIHTSPKPEKKPVPAAELPKAKKTTTQQVVAATPKPPAPKAVYKGGTSANNSGGNGGDSYNGVRNQGIAGGNGDQGKPNGNPNSDSYTGNGGTGKSGVSIRSGLSGRRFTHLPSFTDDFNQNAKVAVDITVNSSGNVIQAMVNPRGTTTTNANIRNIAVTKARQLKLNSSTANEQTGTIVFDFKLRG